MSGASEDARVAALRSELTRDWEMVLRHRDGARSVDPTSGRPESALVALSLDHAYQAFETLLVRIERALGLPERLGAEWHRAILSASARPISDLRAAVVAPDSERDWDELRRFRHFLRHAYTVELDPTRLAAGVVRLECAVSRDDANIRALIDALAARI